ncbi:hypothetical protein SFRURICE_014736 [Spodoptera frugiperda]|uniref:SFRICE_015060 n=1 Tax=Spodoptera frugiperda TaxID=7108 RepID=A0A2H1WZF8_SPOFR|nr:hypothetical protein SFRURICE_014736 [Spodoptera frugiperda]
MFVHLFACMYFIVFDSITQQVVAFISVLDHGIYPLEQGSIGIQFFIDIENNNHFVPCRVHSWPKMCCLADEDYKDCSYDAFPGDNEELIEPKTRETLVYVYPTLYQYDQVGYCDFVIDFKCANNRRARQVSVKIPFDTQFSNKKNSQYLKAYVDVKGNECDSLDEDPLHECEAVNCDLKYAGRRPYYDKSNKCVSAPVCDTNVMKSYPDVVYVPKTNICRDLDHPITIGDIYAISTGLGVVTESTKSHFNNLKIRMKSNCSTISQNVVMLKDMMYGKLCPMFNGDTSGYEECCTNALLSIVSYVIAICGLLLSLVCCLHTTMWCYSKWTKGDMGNSFMCWKPVNTTLSVHQSSTARREITNNLLREVIVKDLPIEMRDSVVDICQRINKEIKQKKRYRVADLGSQINLREEESNTTSDSTSQSSLPNDYKSGRVRLIK